MPQAEIVALAQRPNWETLRIFLAVGRSGSISGASRHLDVSQPTISRRLRELETQLRVRLFDRAITGTRLTRIGREVLTRVADMERQALRLEAVAGEIDAAPEGRVVVTSPDALGLHVIMPLLPAFHETHPGVEIDLHVAQRLVSLPRREADVAIRLGTPEGDNLVGRRLGTTRFSAVASLAYVAARGMPAHPSDLARHAVVGASDGLSASTASQAWAEATRDIRPVVRSNGLLAHHAAATAGLGIAFLPDYLRAASPNLVEVLPEAISVEIEIWMLTHPDLRGLGRIRAVMDFLVPHLRERFRQPEAAPA